MRPAIALLLVLACGHADPGVAGSDETSSTTAPATSTGDVPDATATADSTGAVATTASSGATDASTGDPSGAIPLRFAFVHGVLGSAASQQHAENEAEDLEAWLLEHLDEPIASWQAAHPGITIEVESARLNLYTDTDGALLEPGLDEVADGSGHVTANRWRQQLVTKLQAAFPTGGNIVIVGHSTGARAAVEVAADVGEDGQPGSMLWGIQARIAGVVTLHGMIDRLDDPEYDFIGPTGFETGCKLAQADGWCEYAARISGRPAADWVAANKRLLALVSWASCSPSLWGGENDKSLPLRAQASAGAHGMTVTRTAAGELVVAHGVLYGHYCHSDVTSKGSSAHGDAVAAAMGAVLDWVFVRAPQVVVADEGDQRVDLPAIGASSWSDPMTLGADCPIDAVDLGEAELAGVCRHGDDGHGFDAHNLTELTATGNCHAQARWQHDHTAESHAARLWVKTHVGQGGLVDGLAIE